jgi:hypothetical protein
MSYDDAQKQPDTTVNLDLPTDQDDVPLVWAENDAHILGLLYEFNRWLIRVGHPRGASRAFRLGLFCTYSCTRKEVALALGARGMLPF